MKQVEIQQVTHVDWRFFLWILLFATSADLVIPVVLGRYHPGYNHLVDTISTLGTPGSPVQIYECATLIGVGILYGHLILNFALQAR